MKDAAGKHINRDTAGPSDNIYFTLFQIPSLDFNSEENDLIETELKVEVKVSARLWFSNSFFYFRNSLEKQFWKCFIPEIED